MLEALWHSSPLLLLFISAGFPSLSYSAITKFPDPCTKFGFCLYPASNGWCFKPNDSLGNSSQSLGPDPSTSCVTNSSDFASVMAVHLTGNHSIGYYNLNNTFLGNDSFPVPTNQNLFLCMSGPGGDARLRSWCCDAQQDNEYCNSGRNPCIVDTGPTTVVDKCYGEELVASVSPVGQSSSTTVFVTSFTPSNSGPTSISGGQLSPTTTTAQSSTKPAASVSVVIFAATISSAVVGVCIIWLCLFLLCSTRTSRSRGSQKAKQTVFNFVSVFRRPGKITSVPSNGPFYQIDDAQLTLDSTHFTTTNPNPTMTSRALSRASRALSLPLGIGRNATSSVNPNETAQGAPTPITGLHTAYTS